MTGPAGRAVIRIFTAPDVACARGATWASAVGFVRDRLRRRLGEGVIVEHIEIFSPRSFEFATVLQAIEGGAQLPIILVGDRIVRQGGKLSEARIAQAVETLGW